MRKIHKLCADFTFLDILYDPDIRGFCSYEISALYVVIMMLGIAFGFIEPPEFTDTECIVGVVLWLVLLVVSIGRICELHLKTEE